jgi:nucleoside-diphosphate-sugar epimerase
MKKVLITGAGGFIGSNMVSFLLKNTDFFIYGIDNFINGRENENFLKELISERFQFIENDFIEFDFSKKEIDIVYHFAAIPSVPYSVDFPVQTDLNNINKTVKLLKICSDNKVKKFIFSSSSSIYGEPSEIPTSESSEELPKTPYAIQKLAIEKYCKIWSELYGLDTICLRYFNVYGPNQYSNNAYASVISSWIKNTLTKNEIRIDGDGSQKRCFTFVEDICRANLFFSLKDDEYYNSPINISTNNSVPILEIKDKIVNIIKKDPKIIWSEKRRGDIEISEAETTLSEHMGFKTICTIDEGLKKTIDWYKNKL